MRLRKFMIFGVLLFMVVGFATVSVTFNFNGIASIAADEDDFRVSIRKAKLDGVDIAATAISTDGLTLKYSIEELKNAGDESVLEFAVTNNSKLYDAKMQLNCGEFADDALSLEVTMDADRVNAGENVLGNVTVTLSQDVTEEDYKVEVSCKLKLTALERTSKGDDAPELEDALYAENILNGADPVLADGMIPVVIDDDGTVTYANVNTRWYRYGQLEWANAVILKDDIDSMYNVGNIIKEEDIEAYFVWIPRYRYKLWNVDDYGVTYAKQDSTNSKWILLDEDGNETGETVDYGTSDHVVELIFESSTAKASVGTKNDEWLTHPAFTSLDVNGIWVAKFETGVEGATSETEAKYENLENYSIGIKPNLNILNGGTFADVYNLSLNYNTDARSHLIKNTEWGAILYLALSKYGDGLNTVSGSKVSGYTNIFEYNTTNGVKASTTGNISGVYDMVAGHTEIVSSMVEGIYDYITEEQYNANPNYVDVYPASESGHSFYNCILGDATGELGPFFMTGNKNVAYTNWSKLSFAAFSYSSSTHLGRGGYRTSLLAFEPTNGSSVLASRIVLAPKK